MMKKRKGKGNSKNIKNIKNKKTLKNKNNKKFKISKKQKKLIKVMLNIVIVLFVIGMFGISLFFAYVVKSAPAFNPGNLKYQDMSYIYDDQGAQIAKLGNKKRTSVSYDNLPQILIDAIVATEDARFFQHNGFDFPRFLKASAQQTLRRSNAGGASTITMQVVKNNYTSKTASGFEGVVRKFTDIYLSIFKVEKSYTKKEIIEFYINEPFLGNGAYGIEQASQTYFKKSVKDVTLPEAAMLAGMFQAPSSYNPYTYPESTYKRRKTVLYLMNKHGYITDEEYKIANGVSIEQMINKTNPEKEDNPYQGYVDTVILELENTYDINPYTSSVKIYTAMNKSKQDYINGVMSGANWKWENEIVQSGVIMQDSHNGEVIAVGSGRNREGQKTYNYATMINRQIGSAAKPIFDYGPGIEYNGWSSVTYFKDEPHSYTGGKKINNADGGYRGWLPLYQALGLSRNIPALKAFQQVDNKKIVEFVTGLGIRPEISNGQIHEAHSLGAFTGSSPIEMSAAYSAFANGGYYIKPHTIRSYVYSDTEEKVETTHIKTKVMEDSTAYLVTHSLIWAVNSGLSGAGRVPGVQMAAKTGTTNFDSATRTKNKLSARAVNDLWVVGYSPEYTISLWYGYDKIDKKHHSTTATWSIRDNLFRTLANNLMDKTGSVFKVPTSIVSATVEKESSPLKLASENTPDSMKVVGLFRKGTVPTIMSAKYAALPNINNLKGAFSSDKVTLTWNAPNLGEDFIELAKTLGPIGYDIYSKNNMNGESKYIGTTTDTKYTHVAPSDDVTYTINTAYLNDKATQSSGVEKRIINASIDLNVALSISGEESLYVGSVYKESYPIIVYSGITDVTNISKITVKKITDSLNNTVNSISTTSANNYTIEYKVDYLNASKTISRKVIIKADPVTTTTTTRPTTTIPTTTRTTSTTIVNE